MGWELTDEWPDGRTSGGVFRAAAEIIVATRGAPTAVDRLRLWWHSTPDHPFGAIARRVVLTPGWLYAETRSGGRRRAPLDAVRGSRREAGRVIYAVAEGDDLVVVARSDALERALDEAAGLGGEWRSNEGNVGPHVAVFLFAAIVTAISIALIAKYHDGALDRIARGLWTSESALGLYAGVGGVLLMLLFIAVFPKRYLADTLGLTSVRGLFGWMRSTRPVERVVGVRLETKGMQRSGTDIHEISVVFDNPREIQQVHMEAAKARSADSREKREKSVRLGRRLARIYGVELEDT